MRKEELRKIVYEKRKNLSEVVWKEKSRKIIYQLKNLEVFQKSKTILFYVSYDGEVFTHELIKESLNTKNVVVPKSITNNNTLLLSKLESWEDLKLGLYDILEPRDDKIQEFDAKFLDLIIVPGVAFDLNGNRIGHGKGYYDRLLKYINKPTVSLAFEFQIMENIEVEKFDKKIDAIITEDRIIYCSR